ncbi:DNA ligase [Ideonella sp. DXS29W]|uniref:DNA ligase n=1 Tax=Ideonella lacteola TaxID=2984193 RepID=A0ABU9BSI0_9BURK
MPVTTPVRAAAEPPPALLLAREAADGQDPWGYLVSEKFDGVRAYWDGARLRFRGGGTVAAPAAFLAGLPAGQPLDGELWLGRGRFDELSSIVRRGHADAHAWGRVHYMVFECPNGEGSFAQRVQRLQTWAAASPMRSWQPVEQTQVAHAAALQQRLEHVVADGGEGLVLHRADALYSTGRSDVLLKLKPAHDAEAVVMGYTRGEGRFEGQTGALRVRDDNGREFLVGSGLTDEQRRDPPPLGSVVTYRWRGETLQGLPRFPTLVRVREAGW